MKDVTKTEAQPNPDGEDEEIEVTEQEEEIIEGSNAAVCSQLDSFYSQNLRRVRIVSG